MLNRRNRKRLNCLIFGHELWGNRDGGSFCTRCLDIGDLGSWRTCLDPRAREEAYELLLTFRALAADVDGAVPAEFEDFAARFGQRRDVGEPEHLST